VSGRESEAAKEALFKPFSKRPEKNLKEKGKITWNATSWKNQSGREGEGPIQREQIYEEEGKSWGMDLSIRGV